MIKDMGYDLRTWPMITDTGYDEHDVNYWLTDVLIQAYVREVCDQTKQVHYCIQRLRDSQARKLHCPLVFNIYIYIYIYIYILERD